MKDHPQNPYTSPKSKTVMQQDAKIESKAYHTEQDLLVIRDGANLPQICILTGEPLPLAKLNKKTLSWANPLWGILILGFVLPYFIFYFFFRKKASFTYVISDRFKNQRARIIIICFLISLTGICGIIYLTLTNAEFIDNGLFYITSITATLVGILYAGYNCSSFRVEKYSDGKFYISGPGNGFIAKIQQEQEQ